MKAVELWDLPDNRVYLLLERELRVDLFSYLKHHFGGAKTLSELLNKKIDKTYIYNWKNGIRFLPLATLKDFLRLMTEEERINYQNRIEMCIEKIKAGSNARSLPNVFPIAFSTELARISGHVVGDGGISTAGDDKYNVYYTNKCSRLIEEFKGGIKSVFGDIEMYENVDKRYEATNIKLPKIIGMTLVCFFGFQSNDQKHIPSIIFQSNKTYRSLFLRALFDDEGSVDGKGRHISLMMTDKKIVKGIKGLLLSLGVVASDVRMVKKAYRKRKTLYGISITGYDNFTRFHKKIGFSHPVKQEKLISSIKKYRPQYREGELDRNILKLLKNVEMTTSDLSTVLERSCPRIKQKLQELERDGKVRSRVTKQNLKIYRRGEIG